MTKRERRRSVPRVFFVLKIFGSLTIDKLREKQKGDG